MAQNLGNLFISGDANINDVSSYNHTVTNEGPGTIVVDTNVKKFGAASLEFQVGDYLAITNTPEIQFGTGDFTIDLWMKAPASAKANYRALFIPANNTWWIQSNSSGAIIFGNHVTVFYIGTTDVYDDEWHHIAAVRSSGTVSVYIDGVFEMACPLYDSPQEKPFPATLIFGYYNTRRFIGHLDNLRLVAGEALWSEGFGLTAEDLFYTSSNSYVRPDNISGLYTIGSRGNLRGKASEGFIRPTIKQFFTSKNFEEIESYIAKGYIFGNNPKSSNNDEYNSKTDTWTSKTNMPAIKQSPAATGILEKGYAFGGITTNVGTTSNYEYNPTSNSWTSKTSLLVAISHANVITLYNKGYMLAGYTSSRSQNCDEYEPIGDSWTSKTDMPAPDRYMSASTDILGKGYIYGGLSVAYLDNDEYDSISDSWTSKTNLPSIGRASFAASTMLDKGYAYAGYNFVPSYTTFQNCDEYNPIGDLWTSKTDMIITANSHSACTLSDKGYVFPKDGDTVGTLEYDPVVDSWTTKANMLNDIANAYACSV